MSDGCNRCHRLHGRRSRRARDGPGGSAIPGARSRVFVRPGRACARDRSELERARARSSRALRVQHAAEVVAMDEQPASALRGKKDSSMRVAINLVKQGEAQACVSAGNTGALMAISRFVLKTLPESTVRRSRPSCRRCKVTPTCSISARTSTAPPSICCSSASWARSSWLGRRQVAAAASGCSTSEKKTSRATRS